ncbi:MAG TPA: cyclase family protein [Methylomirabilota bacterium]|nr:cyclase family protein [Methylomirabilota bacterium]
MAVNTDLTEEQVREFFTTLSNWGKWGPSDQLGALNYITSEKRRRAAAEVREGYSVSMSLPLATQPGPDNPTPVMHLMMQTGAPGEQSMVPVPYSADYFAIAPHGLANTHLDALCHVFNQGKMYNGYPSSDVTVQGAKNGAIDALKDGIVSRGVLIDIPLIKNREWLEPGEAISPADLEAAEMYGGFRVEEGDVLFVRTGRHARLKAKGSWDSFKEGLAGLGAACLPWLHARKVAALGSDGASDVVPSGYAKIMLPIHAVAIVAMGIHLLDNCMLDAVAEACVARKRWTFLLVVAPLVLVRGTASPVNPLAMF